MFPLRLCEGKLLVVVTRQRRYGPSRLRVNDDDDDDDDDPNHPESMAKNGEIIEKCTY